MTIFGQSKFLEAIHNDTAHISFDLTSESFMMSKAWKGIPHKVSLRWKYLKNNGGSSFQNLAKSCVVAMATYTRSDWWN